MRAVARLTAKVIAGARVAVNPRAKARAKARAKVKAVATVVQIQAQDQAAIVVQVQEVVAVLIPAARAGQNPGVVVPIAVKNCVSMRMWPNL